MIPEFANKQEALTWMRQNKSLLIRAKKAEYKKADAVYGSNTLRGDSKAVEISKALGGEAAEPVAGILYGKLVINTTNLLDSHKDVHIPGIWKKSLNESTDFLHLDQHDMRFDKVIADDALAYTKSLTWKSLGYDYAGTTQALVFDSTIKQERNPFMFDQYSKGYVKNHSVGMRYVKMFMCVNSEEKWWREEKESWDKYYPEIANKDDFEDLYMFWAVTEAKIIEGSAVVKGSNHATPTLEISEAGKSTFDQIEPPSGTQQPIKSRFASIGSKITTN